MKKRKLGCKLLPSEPRSIRKRIIGLTAASALVATTQPLLAQYPLTDKPIPPYLAGEGQQKFKSSEILPDNKITLRFMAPKASEVKLRFGTARFDQGVYPMSKDATGLWSVTLGPVAPEIYPYSFEVDGVNIRQGQMEVPAPMPRLYDRQHVPHGVLHTHIYFSKVQNRERNDLEVYTPPQYETDAKRRFPVLYLWAGNERGPEGGNPWIPERRLNDIMDNMIAQHLAVPMIVVMMSYAVPDSVGTSTAAGRDMLAKEISTDIIPFIDQHYRTLPNRASRAMAGASQQGATSFDVAMVNLDKIGNLGVFGTGLFGGLINSPSFAPYPPFEFDKEMPVIARKLHNPATDLKFFYMAVGTIDPREPYNEKAVAEFAKYDVKPIFKTFAGGHQDKVWRAATIDFIQMLFR